MAKTWSNHIASIVILILFKKSNELTNETFMIMNIIMVNKLYIRINKATDSMKLLFNDYK